MREKKRNRTSREERGWIEGGKEGEGRRGREEGSRMG